MKEIKIAILGLGRIGQRHSNIIRRLKNFKLEAYIDPRERQVQDISHFSSLEEFFAADIDIDLVVICTPNGFHAAQAVQCIEHGYHVIIEKPMALNTASAEQIIETALHHNKRVFCVMQNRYSAVSTWLKECIENNRLGEIYFVDIQCYWNRDNRYYLEQNKQHDWHGSAQMDGGPLFTQFSHFIDTVYWLLGDWKDIYSTRECFRNKAYTDFEDTGIINFRLGEKTLGNFTYSTAVYKHNLMSAITILAEKGSIRVGGQYMQELLSCEIEDYEIPMETLQAMERVPADNHIHIYENVYDVLYHEKSISTNAYEGMKVVQIIERIYKGAS